MASPMLTIPDPTDDIRQGMRNLDQYGLTIHKNFLTAPQVEQLRQRLDEQASLECEFGVATFDGEGDTTPGHFSFPTGKPHGLPRYQSVCLLANKGRVFIELAKHPVALAYAQHVLQGIQFKVGSQYGYILRNGAPALPLHRDQGPIPFATPLSLTMACVVALGDYTEEMGATRMVPGSHLWQELEPPVDQATLPVIMGPGSAALWDGRVWHGQGASTSERIRYSVVTQYFVHFLSAYECYPASLHDGVYKTMSNEELALYGFEFNGINGRIGPRYPDDPRGNVVGRLPYIPELRR